MANTSTYIPILVSTSAFLAILLFIAGVRQYCRQKATQRKFIQKVKDSPKNRDASNKEGSTSKAVGLFKKRISDFLSLVGKRFSPEESLEYTQMRARFLRAGLRRPNALVLFWGIKCLLAACLPLCFFLIRILFLKLISPTANLFASVVLAFAGFYLPDVWLRVKTSRRKRKIFEGLPDMLDLLVVCMETGMGLNAALNKVAEEIKLGHEILSDELRILNLEMRAGKARQDALRNLAVRIGVDDMTSLVTLLIQTEKFGTSVAQTLRVYSDSFRTKRFQKAEEIAAKVPIKLLFPMIFFIFPSLFVVILGPAAIRIYRLFMCRG